MPLFKSHNNPSPPPPAQQSPPPGRSRSLFSRNRDTSPNSGYPDRNYNGTNGTNGYNEDANGSSGGLFSRRRRSSSPHPDLKNDPSISAARAKVAEAEARERDADYALGQARAAVREARAHVQMLEREALEDARRAKLKQAEAKTVSKSARGLGRHG